MPPTPSGSRQTYALAEAILARLRAFDRTALWASQRVSLDVYDFYLDDLVRERPFIHHVYSINSGLTSEHAVILSLFTQVHPLQTHAEDYVERLSPTRAAMFGRAESWSA
jgi:uncharacterized protein (DUF885 family)